MINIVCDVDNNLTPVVMSGVRFKDCNYTLVALLISDISTKLELTKEYLTPFWYVVNHPEYGFSEKLKMHSLDWNGKDLDIYFFDDLWMDYDSLEHIKRTTNCAGYNMVTISKSQALYYFNSNSKNPIGYKGLDHDLENLKECKNIINNYLNTIDE